MGKSMRRGWKAALAGAILWAGPALSPAWAEEAQISIRPTVQGYFVSGDQGRFREDRKTVDGFTGGVESFVYRNAGIDFAGHAVIRNDYGARLRLDPENPWKLDGNFRLFRVYYDGSNEPWRPTDYRLPSSFADHKDDNMHVEWGNGLLQATYELSENLRLIGGVLSWGRDGKETLAKGSLATATGQLNRRSKPVTRDMEGRSETYYLELPWAVTDAVGLNLKQSFEYYRDDQVITKYRYANGTLSQARTLLDYPTFYDVRTQVGVSAQPSEDLLFSGGYLYDWLKNQSLRSSVRPNLAAPLHFVDPEVENLRVSHTLNGGMSWNNTAGVKHLRLTLGLRAEDADTSARGTGLVSSGTTRRDARSDLEELRFSESLGLVYQGLPKTSLSFFADFEQRVLEWSEWFDARSHEIFTDFSGPAELSYDADIDHNDQTYTALLTNRPHRLVKWSARYRKKDKSRDYDVQQDTSSLFYPGRLLDQSQVVDEASGKVDLHLPKGWMAGLQYQFAKDRIGFAAVTAEDSQNLERHRYSASALGPVSDRLSLFLLGAVERFRITTPVDATATNWSRGSGAYDYDGDYVLYHAAANYGLSDRAKVNLTYQLTSSQGDNKNTLNEVWLGLKYRLDEDNDLDLRYEWFDFHDRRIDGPGFDDYRGHGLTVAMRKEF